MREVGEGVGVGAPSGTGDEPLMDLDGFKRTTSAAAPPETSAALHALWWDAKGDWKKAHACAQAAPDADGAWVHAYLHRKEGDLDNAAYWYRRAGRTPESGALEAEWEAIARALLSRAEASHASTTTRLP